MSGEIKNTGPLDFETKKNFSLVIMAADLGSHSKSTTETLFIKVNVSTEHSPGSSLIQKLESRMSCLKYRDRLTQGRRTIKSRRYTSDMFFILLIILGSKRQCALLQHVFFQRFPDGEHRY